MTTMTLHRAPITSERSHSENPRTRAARAGRPTRHGRSWGGLLGGVLLALSVLGAGCSEDDSTQPVPSAEQTEPDLEAPFGGYTTTDEEPAFGDTELAATVEDEEEGDELEDLDPDLRALLESEDARVYPVTLTWGVLRNPDRDEVGDQAPIHDWSGSVSVNRGGIVLRRIVAFEKNDQIEQLRPDAMSLEWTSSTTVGYDGLRLMVVFPPADGQTEDVFEIETEMFRASFTARELADLDYVETISGTSQQIRIQSYLSERTVVLAGFLAGGWFPPGDDGLGRFEGRWIDQGGIIQGFVRGVYGERDGEGVLFGKMINRSGRFEAFLRGTYEHRGFDTAVRSEHGTFTANILRPRNDATDGIEVLGQTRGRWWFERRGQGFFDGRWCMECELMTP